MAIDLSNDWINTHLKFVLAKTLNTDINNITKDYLKSLNEIDLSDCGLVSLKGIQYATNLTSLNLSRNEIVDANLLSELHRLTNLELSENRVNDVCFLSELKNLKSIGLDSNNISRINSLSNLKNLTMINISNNKIKDLLFVNTLHSKNIKIIASEQVVILEPIDVNYGDDYIFKSPIMWDNEIVVLLDNIQVTGKYNYVETNKRPSILYSISKIFIRNIQSDCLLKSDFYHEVPFLKSGILSGILIQPIIVKLANSPFNIFQTNKVKISGTIHGKLQIKNIYLDNETFENNFFLKGKLIILINSVGDKISYLTNERGEYEFLNLRKDRYTILFPFLDEYEYVTPSLYVCNLDEDENLEINSIIIKH